jgi:hypothetical protein
MTMRTVSHHAAGPPTSVEQLLAAARAQLRRLTPEQAYAAMREGAVLVDIRSDRQRATGGVVPGARFVPRNVLEWRLDPACPNRDAELGRRRRSSSCSATRATSRAWPPPPSARSA